MKPSEMLRKMCHGVLSSVDIKALCKARGLPPEAGSSRGILETLFLSPQGLSSVFDELDANEIALLHLLKSIGTSVDVAFFAGVYGVQRSYGTFNQRHQSCFAKIKQRLVRRGVILWAETPQRSWEKLSKMERWRFAFPTEFHSHLPPLIGTTQQFEGDGNWRSNVARDKLIKDLGARKHTGNEVAFQIEAGELRLAGKLFATAELTLWQQAVWKQAIRVGKKSGQQDRYSQHPAEATLCILSELATGHWAAAEQLMEPLQVYCGRKIDADAWCQAGWQWGLLAKRRAGGRDCYRLAPEPRHVAPHQYLMTGDQDDCVMADLKTIPLDVLEQIVTVSDQCASHDDSTLRLTPNFIKLGRATDEVLASEAVRWLVEQTPAFAEVCAQLSERRGKTVLHEHVCIAKVSDLSLRVSIEKALGNSFVALKSDFVAFPIGRLDEVRRVVKKSGHVVKEVTAK